MKIVLLSLLLMGQAHAAITLKDSFEMAKKNMEILKRSGSQIKAAIERKNQARAAMLPTISGFGNETRIDRPTTRPGVSRAFILTRQYSAGLRLQQPLIRGGIFSAWQTRSEEIVLAEFQKSASEVSLYQLVINAYYNLHFAKQDLKNLSELLRYSKQRQLELESLTKVGRSRRGELIQAQTQYLAAQAQYRQGEMNYTAAAENFEFFTGLKAEELAPLSMIPKELPEMTELIKKMNHRPDLKARRQEVKVADQRMGVVKGAYYPQVDLVSNYYFDRTGVLQTSEWDVAVVLNVPLFQGGSVVAQVREAAELKRQAELNSDETTREARRDLVVLYQNYSQIQSQLEVMRGALAKAEEAYKLNLKDYRMGQVTNLEVLQGLNLFIETKRSYDGLISQSHLTYKNLEASTGVLP
jgi:outer membrane protein